MAVLDLRISRFCMVAYGLVLAVSGCTGSVTPVGSSKDETDDTGRGGGSANSAGGNGVSGGQTAFTPLKFSCDSKQAPAEVPMRRLTNVQYVNTIRDLLSAVFLDKATADAVFGSLRAALDAVPKDERKRANDDPHGSYRRLDQDVQQAHVTGYYNVANAFAAAVTTTARLPALLGSCASEANAKTCVSTFLHKFAERALRRPLAADETDFFISIYGEAPVLDAAALADTIAVILNHPAFLFQTEHGDAAAGSANSLPLTAFERANRLSYHFWQTMPDEALWAAARSGALLTEEGYTAAVERLFFDPRTAATIDSFVGEWLKLEDVRAMNSANLTPLEKAFAGKLTVTPDLRQHMVDEVVDLTRHLIWTGNGSMREMLTTDLSFAKTADLRAIYGFDNTPSATDAPQRFAADKRPGLLTRAAFLANSSPETRPVMKGVFIRKNILCDDLPQPPNNAANTMPSGDVSRMTTRERIASLTEAPGSNCAGCHQTIINPLGFATEGFDALGRVRDEQVFFDAGGKEIGRAPVDTRSVPLITDDDNTMSSGAADVMRLAVDSGKPESCLARNYLRFALGRWDDTERDGCALEKLRTSASNGGSLKDMFRAVALTDSFKTRTFQ